MDIKTATAAATEGARLGEDETIPAETLAAITAAATVFLGANLRIGSVHLQQTPHENVSRWTQQGRVLIQASHNLRTKR